MKKKISAILLIIAAVGAMLSFSACSDVSSLYGTYEDADNRVILVLEQDKAYFGSLDTLAEYHVNYVNGGKTIGINKDGWLCYWGTFTDEFTNNNDDTLTFEGYIPTDGNDESATDEIVNITLIKL